uniref:Uncharacterized protein n=1 Tax=Microviridae sp. ctbkO13 TaxID=2825003 RepID=A0A8S5R2G5_9VIRU|nr:MAG TPA: hypothetical protein [Microviridae sp. ctbkO13]
MDENKKTLFRASIEVRDYSEINKSVLNPENADKIKLNLGIFEKPSQAEKFRKRLAENNVQFTFLLTLTEEVNYEQTTDL